MWPRDFEVALALWLAVGPLVLGGDLVEWWPHELACALVIGTLAVLSYHRRLHRAHLFELVVAAWLVGSGWWTAWSGGEATVASQQHVAVGLLVAMLAIIPSDCLKPPKAWRYDRGAEG